MQVDNLVPEVVDCAVYMNRYRGTYSKRNYFIAGKTKTIITWYIEPVNLCSSVDNVIEAHPMQDEDLLLGGMLTNQVLDLYFKRVALDDLCKIIVGSFGARQRYAPHLSWFTDARIALNAISLDVGSIGDVVKKFPRGL
jgi:hypothetical protein